MKNVSKKIISLILMLCMAFVMIPAMPAHAAGTTRVDCSRATISPGSSIIVNLRNPNGPVLWSSTKPSVATVKFIKGYYDTKTNEVVSKAKITAHKAGKITITAKSGGKTYSCKVTVKKGLKTKLSCTKKTIRKGEYFSLQLLNPVNPEAKVSASNNKVSIRNGGYSKGSRFVIIKGERKGKVKIRVKDKGGKIYTCTVTVR